MEHTYLVYNCMCRWSSTPELARRLVLASPHTEGGRCHCSGLDQVSCPLDKSALGSTRSWAGTGRSRTGSERTSPLWSHSTCLVCKRACRWGHEYTNGTTMVCTPTARADTIWIQSCEQSRTVCSDTGPACHCTSLRMKCHKCNEHTCTRYTWAHTTRTTVPPHILPHSTTKCARRRLTFRTWHTAAENIVNEHALGTGWHWVTAICKWREQRMPHTVAHTTDVLIMNTITWDN